MVYVYGLPVSGGLLRPGVMLLLLIESRTLCLRCTPSAVDSSVGMFLDRNLKLDFGLTGRQL